MSTSHGGLGVTFCGVGEAFDESLPNTCLHLHGAGTSLLLDCGFTAAAAFWRYAQNPQQLDAVCISHFHGDHFCGLPQLVGFFMSAGRTAPLSILGQLGVRERTIQAVNAAYGSLLKHIQFPLEFIETAPGASFGVGGLRLNFARTRHSKAAPNLAVRVDAPESCGGASVFYSGDGGPTPESTALALGCTLAVQEAYGLERALPHHGSVADALGFAATERARSLALVHVSKHVRRGQRPEIEAAIAQSGVRAFVPEPGHGCEL